MAIDWKDQTREDVLTFQMVSPTNVDKVYGELENVDLSASTLTAAYYTDTRTSGKIRVVGDSWIRGSMIRVIHSVPEWGYKKELGTYIVTADDATYEHGEWVYDLTLNSRLYGLSTDKHPRPWTIAKNARALTAMQDSLKAAGCPYTMLSPKDKTYKSAKVVESGTTRLSALFDLANAAGDRLDVNGHGRVTIAPYVNPSSVAASFTIDLADERGIAVDGISRSTDWLEMADVAVISHKFTQKQGGKSVEREVTGIAYVSSSMHQAHAKRGYTVTNFQSLSEMSPETTARAQALANAALKKEQRELVEWTMNMMYLPIWEGDTVTLKVHDGLSAYQGARKCLVKSLDLDLAHMTMKVTLKETASGDKGDEK